MRRSQLSRYIRFVLLACFALSGLMSSIAYSAPSDHSVVKNVLARKEFQQYTARAHPPLSPSASSGRAVLRDVLSREEFQRYTAQRHADDKPSALERMLVKLGETLQRGWNRVWKPVSRVLHWLDRRMSRLTPRVPPGKKASFLAHLFHYILIPLLALAFALLLGLIVYRWYFARQRRSTLRDEDPNAQAFEAQGLPALSAWEKLLQTVETLWREGQQREALRTLHGACLALLDRRGILRYEHSRANGEVLRELRRQGQAQARQTLQPIFRAFDRSWYGFLPISPEEFSEVKEQSRQFHAGIREGHDA